MAIYNRFLKEDCENVVSYQQLKDRFEIIYGDNFNFAYDVMDKLASEQPGDLAMLWVGADGEEKRFSYKDLEIMSNKAANALTKLGIKKGDPVMLVLKRHYQFWYTMLALHKIGAVMVPVTHQLTSKEYVYRCNAAGVRMVLATGTERVVQSVNKALPKCPQVEFTACVGGGAPGWLDYDALVEQAPQAWSRPDDLLAKDMMLVAFSSGTTGYPKMVWHDFTYPLGHLITGKFWHNVVDGGLHFTISDTGWMKSLWGKAYGQWLGGSAVFVYDFDKFVACDILEKLEKYPITSFCAPPTMYRFMVQEDVARYDLSSITHCATAGEALNPEIMNKWRAMTGQTIYEGFGQSETALCLGTFYPYMEPMQGSMGLPAPGYEIRLLDKNGNKCPPGKTGEICVWTEGPKGVPLGLFRGYYRDDVATARAWHDGYYHTGDTAYTDETGLYWYVGRVDDVIKSSGYRIGPFEVESALMEHSAVVECAVTGVPDPVRGYAVKATIVLAKGYEGSDSLTKELQNHVKSVTAPYKYPRVIEYVEHLPKTATGKIRRVEIRERDAQQSPSKVG